MLTLGDGTDLDREAVLIAVALERIDQAFERGLLEGSRPEINAARVAEVCDAALEAEMEFDDAEVEDAVRILALGLHEDG